jgi:hypothetical protein
VLFSSFQLQMYQYRLAKVVNILRVRLICY